MNKLISKIVGVCLGLTLAVGTGVAIGINGNKVERAQADTQETASVDMSSFGWGSTSQNAKDEANAANIDANGDVKFYTTGTGNNGKYYSDWRLYYSGSGDVNVKAYNNCTIKTVTFTYSTSNNGKLHSSSAKSVSNPAYSSGTAINVNATSFRAYVAQGNTSTNGQVRITNISVTYTKPSSDVLSSINLAASSKSTTVLSSATVKTGKTLQVYLTANYSTAGALDKTQEAEWTATDGTGSATVSKGLITGLTVGTVTISASYGGLDPVSLALTVIEGPKVTLSRSQITPFLEKETMNDISISLSGFESSSPVLSVSSSSANVSASIVNTNNLKLAAGNNISSDETVNVTVTATGNNADDSASAVVKVHLKAPVFTLSASSIDVKPTANPVVVTSTIKYFGSEPTLSASGSNNNIFTVSVSETEITVTPVAEGSGTLTATVTSADESITRTITVPVNIADVLEYQLINDASLLTEDSKLIIAATVNNSSYAMGEQGTNTYRASVATTIANDKISGPSSSVKIITLEGETDDWYLKTDEGYLSYSSSRNAIYTSETKSDTCSWKVSVNEGVATIESNKVAGRTIRYNSGNPRFACYASGQTSIKLFGILAPAKTVVGERMTNGTVSASNYSTEWKISGFTFELEYSDGSFKDVTEQTTFNVAESIPTITQNGTMDVTVTPTYKETVYSSAAATVNATLRYAGAYSIERLYYVNLAADTTSSEQYTFDGIYMGFVSHVYSGTTYYDYYVGNGDFGMLVYGASTTEPSYVIGETSITVTGYMKNYRGLYEIAYANSVSPTVTILDETVPAEAQRIADIETPNTYVVTGNESAANFDLASRKTSLSGIISKIGSETTPGTTATKNVDNKIYVTVNGQDVLLYVKAAQLPDDTTAGKFVIGQRITIDGYSTFNNVFQVIFTEIVDADPNYHAADFARNLLKMTMGLCNASYTNANNKSALTSIWTTLSGASHWLKIQANGETSALVDGTPDSSVVVPATESGIMAMSDSDALSAALYRYDYCTAKYSLTNFIGRTLTVSFNSNVRFAVVNNNALVIVAITAFVGVTFIGGYFFLRKKKEQ